MTAKRPWYRRSSRKSRREASGVPIEFQIPLIRRLARAMVQLSWSDYRKRQAILVVLLVGFPLACIWPVAICWMIAYAVAGYYVAYFPCPRCQRPFFYRGWIYNPWANQCEHCNWIFGCSYDPLHDPPHNVAQADTLFCLSCGDKMTPNLDACPKCGGSYQKRQSSNNRLQTSPRSGVGTCVESTARAEPGR